MYILNNVVIFCYSLYTHIHKYTFINLTSVRYCKWPCTYLDLCPSRHISIHMQILDELWCIHLKYSAAYDMARLMASFIPPIDLGFLCSRTFPVRKRDRAREREGPDFCHYGTLEKITEVELYWLLCLHGKANFIDLLSFITLLKCQILSSLIVILPEQSGVSKAWKYLLINVYRHSS